LAQCVCVAGFCFFFVIISDHMFVNLQLDFAVTEQLPKLLFYLHSYPYLYIAQAVLCGNTTDVLACKAIECKKLLQNTCSFCLI
jgi:hypothetical protein